MRWLISATPWSLNHGKGPRYTFMKVLVCFTNQLDGCGEKKIFFLHRVSKVELSST